MGNFLYKFGKASFTHYWRVIIIWLIILFGLGTIGISQYQPLSNSINIPGTSAQKTLDRFSKLFPDVGEGSAKIVFAAKDNNPIAKHKVAIEDISQKLKNVKDINQVITPFENPNAISDNNKIAFAELQLEHGMGEVDKATIDGIDNIVSHASTSTLQVEVSGDAIDKVPGDIIGVGEITGIVLALAVLIITLGALVAAGLPIIIAIVTVGVGGAGLIGLSQVIDITATTPVLAIMIGLAVGIDYSLFIISKYKHSLLAGYQYREAAAKSIATAGKAVLFAATTVVIALASLAVVQIPFMTIMGLAGAATVAIAGISAVTLLPALLGATQNKIFRSKTRKKIEQAQKRGPKETHRVNHQTFWYRTGGRIVKRPVLTLTIAILAIVSIALPARSLELGLPTDEYAAVNTTERKAYDLLAKGFGEGFNGPLLAVVENIPAVTDQDRQIVKSQLQSALQKKLEEESIKQKAIFQEKTQQVTTPQEMAALQQEMAKAKAEGEKQQKAAQQEITKQAAQYSKLYQLNKIANKLKDIPDVAQVTPAMVTDSGHEGVIQIVSKHSPSSKETHNLVERLRSDKLQNRLDGSTIDVTGSAALQIDVNDKLAEALPVYLAVIVGLSLILLVVAFRSILVPIKATLGFLLSVFAMFGALVAIFQWGWFGIADAPGPIVSFIPIISIGVLFGLAMDYEFFLVSSIHEEYQRSGNAKRAVINGFGIGSKVVAAAGAIMVAIFASFITNDDTTIQAIGFGLAIGILIDAFIVRMVIVPAIMTLLGRSAWWLPKWLNKLLPDLGIDE